MAKGNAYGHEVVSFMDHAFKDLNKEEAVVASSHAILGAKVHRKVAQGYKEMGTMARLFNDFTNCSKDIALEYTAGSIAKNL